MTQRGDGESRTRGDRGTISNKDITPNHPRHQAHHKANKVTDRRKLPGSDPRGEVTRGLREPG